jgi:hypothetical protein
VVSFHMKAKRCTTKGCKKDPGTRKFCTVCRNRKSRHIHLIKYLYTNLKYNAKRRGKEFTLSLDEFTDFCNKTKYDQLKGQAPDALSIDRIDNTKGYTINNIRAITIHDNSSKGAHIDPDWQKESNCPF